MHLFSLNHFFTFGLLAAAPLASAYAIPSGAEVGEYLEKRFVVCIKPHSHNLSTNRSQAGGSIFARHHTEAQIAAKTAAAKKHQARDPHHTEAQIAAKTAAKKKHQARDPHHTEAQIAAKTAAKKKHQARDAHHTEAQIAAKTAANKKHQARDPHHTEAQIAAKAAAKKNHSTN
jgi:hypothetical protein